MADNWLTPDWPAPAQVQARITTRRGGVSAGSWASMNPADHVGDAPAAVAANRARLEERLALPGAPRWLRQVHGKRIVEAAGLSGLVEADGAWTATPGVVCAVLTADCLPVLLCDREGCRVAAVHAGWRGLAAGVLEEAVTRLRGARGELLAWLGPAISGEAYVVGDEVRRIFLQQQAAAQAAFRPADSGGWHADLYALARQRLAGCRVHAVYGGDCCTFREPERFYSYRRDGQTGRMASLIWLRARPGFRSGIRG
ncbi:MAG: peptidoglycan editing factor PgeF [Gammaproteobacteria bacterium]